MTTIAEPSTLAVLGRTIRAERARLWTLRSTWIVTSCLALGVIGICLLVGFTSDTSGPARDGEAAWIPLRRVGMFALLGLIPLAATGATADYATGSIMPTMQWSPRRGILLLSRTVAVVLTVTACGLAPMLLGIVLVTRVAPVGVLPWAEASAMIGALGVVYPLVALLAVGLGLLTRSTAGALVAVIGLLLVLPLLVGNLPVAWAGDLVAMLPGTSVRRLIIEEGPAGLTATDARVSLALWGLGAVLAGGARLVRADAS
ncbi:MAG: hypothetical protein ACRCYQ_01750 [Nocardioides sp.]